MEEVIKLKSCEVNYFIGKDGLPKSQVFTVGEQNVEVVIYVCRGCGIQFVEVKLKTGQIFRFFDIHVVTWME